MKKLLILFLTLASLYGYAQVPALNDIVRTNTLSPAKVANALDGSKSFIATGTDTYAITTNLNPYPGAVTYAVGDMYTVNFTNSNTSTTITLNVDGEGIVSIKDNAGNDLAIGDLEAGGTYKVRFNGTNFRIVGATGGGGLTPPIDATDIADGSVTDTEFQYINSLSSNAQTQLNAKQDTYGAQTATHVLAGPTPSFRALTADDLATLTTSRTLTSADDLDQTDNLRKVYVSSASPFDVTVDLLTAGSEVTIINIGSATVTLIDGAGVTINGGPVAIAADENAIVVYRVAATPDVYTGTTASGSVSLVTFTGGIISVANGSTTPAFTVAGTSGGIPYFSSSSTWATSAALAANALVVGGGAGVAPSTVTTGAGVLTFLGTPSYTNFLSAITGTSPYYLNASGGALTGDNAFTGAFKIGFNNKGFEINQTAQSSSWIPTIKVLNGAHTALTATTEFIQEDYGTSSPATLTWATGTVATQRDRLWRGLNHSGANPTAFTRLIGNQFDVPTVSGTGVTVTNAFALASNGPFVVYGGDGTTERFKVNTNGTTSILGTNFTFSSGSLVIGAGLGLGLSNQAANSEGRISGIKELLGVLNGTVNIMTSSVTGSGPVDSYVLSTGFAPTSGTGIWKLFKTTSTVNQTGGANGNVILFSHEPTYTAAGGNVTWADYNPTITSIAGTHYGLLVRPTGSLNGFGTATPTSTVSVNGSWAGGYVAKTGAYTATVNDYTIECTANTFQVTLPTAVGITGRIYHIVNSGAGTITVGTTSSQTFVNVTATPTSLSMATVGTTSVQSNGANWIKLSGL